MFTAGKTQFLIIRLSAIADSSAQYDGVLVGIERVSSIEMKVLNECGENDQDRWREIETLS